MALICHSFGHERRRGVALHCIVGATTYTKLLGHRVLVMRERRNKVFGRELFMILINLIMIISNGCKELQSLELCDYQNRILQ